jgi:hypothetical protein
MHRRRVRLTEAVVVLATIARHWRLRPAVRPEEVRMLPGATLTPSQLPMLSRRRTTMPRQLIQDTPDYPIAS